jgi:hypothetical protein
LEHLPNPIRKPVEKQKNITLLDHLPNPIRKNVETQKNTTLLEHLPNPVRKTEEKRDPTVWYFLCFYIFSDWIRKMLQQCGIFCFSTVFLTGLGRCSNSVVFFCVSTFFLIGLGIEKKKIHHCWSTYLIQSEKM